MFSLYTCARMLTRFLYLTVFVSGMATLAIEITAARLLGAVFGTSNLVWASIIGLILIYLTAGYFLGGKWADRSPYARTLYTILAWGGFTAGLVPLLARLVLPLAAAAFDDLSFGVLAGSFVGVLVLFAVPVTLLGTISPFAIRLAIKRPREAGTVSGRIYAVSTLGSFLGTFLPVLFLIPLVGTTYTFLTFSLVLVLAGLTGLGISAGRQAVLRLSWMPVLLLLLALMWSEVPFKRSQGQIFETESAYNYIQVLQTGEGYTLLRLNEGQGIHSIYHPEELVFFGPWMQFLAAPFLNPDFNPQDMQRMAIVGLAAGTTARQATAVFGPIPIDGFEIDPQIIEVGRRFFDMNLANLHAMPQDGRLGLRRSAQSYTLIALDAYRPPYIPWHLTTREFFQIAYDHLDANGVLAVNVARAPDDTQMLEGLVGTIESVFPSVYVIDLPGTFNSMLYAPKGSGSLEDLARNQARLEAQGGLHPLLQQSLARAITHQRPTPPSSTVFTDDWAPIEWITNNMVLNFLFTGGVDTLE